jgi:potassium-transporting ATPase potassium-binding subunit
MRWWMARCRGSTSAWPVNASHTSASARRSSSNGNGSAFAGLSANTDWYNTTLGLTMLAGRYLTIVPVLALAGSMARVRVEASSPATLATHGPVFVTFHLAIVLLLGGLSYLPMLVLGLVGESITI